MSSLIRRLLVGRQLYKNSWSLVNSRRVFCSKNDGDGGDDPDKAIPASLKGKFETFDSGTPSKPILDYHEELYGIHWDERHKEKEMDTDDSFYLYRRKKTVAEKAIPFSTTRGIDGVFDVQDLVDALKSEKVRDLCVVKIPPEAHYCDYLVLVTCRNVRHLRGTVEFIRKLHKVKKNEDEPNLDFTIGKKERIIGNKNQADYNWLVLDMKNIVLHLFLPGVREVYDIETLWSVGPEFDEKTVRPTYDTQIDEMEKHVKFIESLVPGDQTTVKV